MRIVIAPDSFKGSLTAREAAEAIKLGIEKVIPDAGLVLMPVADGGEGTLEALTSPENRYEKSVCGPYGDPVRASWGYRGDCAVIEMAEAAGLCKSEKRHTAEATTFGVGELIREALDRGFRKIVLTAGGSATTDGGCGMMAALGVRFFDGEGRVFVPTGGTLCDVCYFDLSGLAPGFAECEFTIAADIKNPLLGKDGSAYVYGPQKGATKEELDAIEEGMAHLAGLLKDKCGRDVSVVPGCGAAGGLPAFLLAFADAKIRPGIDTVLEAAGLDRLLSEKTFDAVITGEGKIDRQSLWGKTISGVCKAASLHGVPVDVLAGCSGDDPEELKKLGLRSVRTLVEIAPSADEAIANAGFWLSELASIRAREYLAEKSET